MKILFCNNRSFKLIFESLPLIMDIITISVSISISSNSSSGGSSSSSSGNSNSSSSELPVSLVFGAHMALLLAKFRLCFRVQ